MKANLLLKDLTDISIKIDICTIAEKYIVSAFTNVLEGDINAYIRIDSCEDDTLGRTVLFSLRNGEQIRCSKLSYKEQLRIPDDYLAHLQKSLSVEFEFGGQKRSIWRTTIEKINARHTTDINTNFKAIPIDLPIPKFKYMARKIKNK